jgi:nucleotide-binding universal stress UspA family protein
MSGILVGVDGSYHSRAALGWAVREAAQHHCPLTVMAVHKEAPRPATGIYWGIHNYAEDSFDAETTRKAVAQLVDEVAHETGEKPLEVTVNVTMGDVAAELIGASRDADMVVVGSRGSGGFAGLLMGSVSSKVAHHAKCPVVVIRGT